MKNINVHINAQWIPSRINISHLLPYSLQSKYWQKDNHIKGTPIKLLTFIRVNEEDKVPKIHIKSREI